METTRMNVHSQEYMETMARLMSEALESPEGMRALAAACSTGRGPSGRCCAHRVQARTRRSRAGSASGMARCYAVICAPASASSARSTARWQWPSSSQ